MGKNILFITRLYYPHVGGIEKHIEKISQILQDKNYSVTVLTTKYDRKLLDSEIFNRIKIIRFNQPQIKYLGLIYTWIWFLKNRNLIKKSDIVHIHDVFIWYLPFKIIYPRKKVFITYHGRWGKYPIPLTDIIQKRIGTIMSNGVISVGDYITKNYGIKSDIITYGATDIPKNIKTKENKLVIYVGRIDKDIALPIIFEVFKKLKGNKIIFCGDGDLSYEANLYGEVRGFVDPQSFYRKAKYCFASGYLTILEALANKCLVFCAYNNNLQRDYYELAPFRKYIICSMNSRELYEKFKYYQRNPKQSERLIKDGYHWIKNQTWEKMVKNYLTIWEE